MVSVDYNLKQTVMNEQHLIDTTGRIELFGVTEGFNGFVVAELAAVDEYISSSRAVFKADKFTYTLELPGVCLNLNQPSAFNMVTLRLVNRLITDNTITLKTK